MTVPLVINENKYDKNQESLTQHYEDFSQEISIKAIFQLYSNLALIFEPQAGLVKCIFE